MKQKQADAFKSAFVQPLTPEQEAAMKRTLARWKSAKISFPDDGETIAVAPLTRRQKVLWFIVGMGAGLALAWAAVLIGILWVV